MSKSLNPCFNGRYSQRVEQFKTATGVLNPCFNGRYSQRTDEGLNNLNCLNPCFNGRYSQSLLRLRIRMPEIKS